MVKYSPIKMVSLLLFLTLIIHTVNSKQSSEQLYYRIYYTTGVYIGYSKGAGLGIGPKFSIGLKSFAYNKGDAEYYIGNNITTGYIRHFGALHPIRELLFETQVVNMKFSNFFIPDYCAGGGAGISLVWYQKYDNSRYFYARPRISLFAGNILFLNVSKSFGLPKDENYTGFHLGGTAVLGFQNGFYLWD